MRAITIQHNVFDKQLTRDGKEQMTGKALTSYLHSIIREYGKITSDGYSLFVSDLPIEDIKILLSHALSASDYEDSLRSSVSLQAYLLEVEDYLQDLINDELNTVYHEDMREMGIHFAKCSINGELIPVRRAS